MNRVEYTEYAIRIFKEIIQRAKENNESELCKLRYKKNKLESAEVFFEAVGCSFAGHSQLARNLLDDLAKKYNIDHVKI